MNKQQAALLAHPKLLEELNGNLEIERCKVALLEAHINKLLDENKRLRRELDNVKVRSYELGQRELHDMALAGLKKGEW